MKRHVQLYVRYNAQDNFTLLDIDENSPIKMNLKAQELTEPGTSQSSYSQVFKLKNTETNGKFFKNAFNVNSSDFIYRKKCEAYIAIDGETIFNGFLLLLHTVNNEELGNIEYEVSFFTEIANLSSQIGDLTIGKIDFPYLFDFTNTNPFLNLVGENSPALGCGIPNLVEWGYTYDDEYNIPEQASMSIGYTSSFITTPLSEGFISGGWDPPTYTSKGITYSLFQSKPWINLKLITDYVYNNFTTYNIKGFFNEPLYKQLGILSDSDARPATNTDTPYKIFRGNRNDLWAQFYSYITYIGGTPYKNRLFSYYLTDNTFFDPSATLVTPTEFVDLFGSNNLYLNQASVYEGSGAKLLSVNVSDAYDVKMTGKIEYTLPTSYVGYHTAYVQLVSNSTNYLNENNYAFFQSIHYTDSDETIGSYTKYTRVFNIEEKDNGDPMTVYSGQYTIIVGIYTESTYTDIIQSKFNINIYSLSYDNIAKSITTYLDDTLKVKDLIKSLNSKFNLVYTPDKHEQNTINVTPWVDWITQGNEYDWTNKLDVEKGLQIKPYPLAKSYTWTDQLDEDYLNKKFYDANGRVFGSLTKLNDNFIVNDEVKFETIFAPLLSKRIDIEPGVTGYAAAIGGNTANADYFLPVAIPVIASEVTDRIEPIKPKPRLCFKHLINVNPTGSDPQLLFISEQLDDSIQYSINRNYSHAFCSSLYPLFNTNNVYQTIGAFGGTMSGTSPLNLNWENDIDDNFIFSTESQYGNYTSIYKKYWSTWYDYVSDRGTKLVTGYFYLTKEDISKLNFNDRIYVKDSWYFINNIEGYNLAEDGFCKVELYSISGALNLKIYGEPKCYAHTVCYSPSTGSTCEACCCRLRERTVYGDSPNFEDCTTLRISCNGDYVPQGWYSSDGFVGYVIGGTITSGNGQVIEGTFGELTGITACSSVCSCEDELVDFKVCYLPIETGGCSTCCCDETLTIPYGEGLTIYGVGATFEESPIFYNEASGATLVQDGYYHYGDWTVLIINGIVVQYIDCRSNCDPCPTVYPHVVWYGSEENPCDACCQTGSMVIVYTDNIDWLSSTVVYSDMVGMVDADDGYYGNPDATYSALSGVLTLEDCDSLCGDCGTANDVYVAFVTSKSPNPEIIITIEKSNGNGNWYQIQQYTYDSSVPLDVIQYNDFSVSGQWYIRCTVKADYVGTTYFYLNSYVYGIQVSSLTGYSGDTISYTQTTPIDATPYMAFEVNITNYN